MKVSKNIHVLPTDKPSNLFLWWDLLKTTSCLIFDSSWKESYKKVNNYINQNIYIASDEEIKEGDWFYSVRELIEKAVINYPKGEHFGKIILTTDQDLIKDGVQAIDDTFLEWFVKNPSCEEIEAKIVSTWWNSGIKKDYYKIIIPKEEPCSFCKGTGQTVSSTTISGFKICDCIIIPQAELPSMVMHTEELSVNEILNKYGEVLTQDQIETLEKLSRETLEEAAERILFENTKNVEIRYRGGRDSVIKSMLDIAKWQQERMYSEEEFLQALNIGFTSTDETWEECIAFAKEQFKKK